MILDSYFTTLFETEAHVAWPRQFAVVTAWNPMGIDAPADANDTNDRRLAKRLDEMRLRRTRVTGISPDGLHREAGWAFWPCDEAGAVALGREFQQLAVYFVADDLIHVISCDSDERAEVDRWSSRLKG